jgi:Leucine-rich repeat (LRR) protein
MFIKKDLRKIPKILEDAVDCTLVDEGPDDDEDERPQRQDDEEETTTMTATKRVRPTEPLVMLSVGRRSQEFCGSTRLLCEPRFVPKLTRLQNLNLYDNQLTDVAGLGTYLSQSSPNLHTINLGRNPISVIPDDFGLLRSLRNLWLDDCQLGGDLPRPILDLPNLETLRAPNNHLTAINLAGGPVGTGQPQLRILCLDRNHLTDLPPDMARWVPNLEELYVRHNRLETIGQDVLPATAVRILHLSSNLLTDVDFLSEADGGFPRLTHLYVNSNRLSRLPDRLLHFAAPNLRRLLISHNPTLSTLPNGMWEYIHNNNNSDDTTRCEVLWLPNPNLVVPPQYRSEDHDGDQRMDD